MKIRDLTVCIQTFDASNEPIGYGTGFLVGGNGLIATCYHVLEDSSFAVVNFSGSELIYKVNNILAIDEGSDLALITANVKRDGLMLSESKAEIGEKVLAFGNPKGLEGTVSDGIVSSIRVCGKKFPAPFLAGTKIIQTTAAISAGSSGGPVVNKSGKVIGIVVSTRQDGQNLNFALPVEYLSRLISNKSKPAQSKKITFVSDHSVLNKDEQIVSIPGEIEWLNVLKSGTKVYATPSLDAKILGRFESLKTLVFIESIRIGSTGMILVGDYLGDSEVKQIGWIIQENLL